MGFKPKKKEPKVRDPYNKQIQLTLRQLNTRAIITARQAIETLMRISERLKRGISGVRVGKVQQGFSLIVAWHQNWKDDLDIIPADVQVEFAAFLDRDMGEVRITPYYGPNCPQTWKDEIEAAIDLLQFDAAAMTRKVKQDIEGKWGA
jgi:hypothetical protein